MGLKVFMRDPFWVVGLVFRVFIRGLFLVHHCTEDYSILGSVLGPLISGNRRVGNHPVTVMKGFQYPAVKIMVPRHIQ